MKSYSYKRRRRSAISLIEVIVVVGVLGVISAIAIPTISNTFGQSKRVVSRDALQTINLGLKQHEQVNYKFKLDPVADSIVDELAIIRSLQYRDAADPAPGSPFLPPKWNPVESSDIKDVRIVWTGHFFRVLDVDKPGTGLKLDLEANDYGENYTFPDDFVPVGG